MGARTEYQRQWRAENPTKRAEQKRRWREKNAEHIREYRRQYREKNLEKVREYHNQWNKEHRDIVNAKERERQREKARQRDERRRELERQSQIQLIAERRQAAMWLRAMGMPAQRISPTPATAAAVNQLAADEFFSRKRDRATILGEKPERPSDRWHNSDASARKSAAIRAARREEARARRAAYKTPQQLARLAEEARMDEIAREINARLRLRR